MIKERLNNKKGASVMEFFILTVVALVVGAAIFGFGGQIKSGVDSGTKLVTEINKNLES